jgi:septum formation protein
MGVHQPGRLILASGSSARRQLLERAGYDFEVLPAGIDEPTGAEVTDIREFVHRVAWLKAAAVAPRVAMGVVLAADSVGWLGGEVIGKPADEDDARRILRLLGGTVHELWTGVVLWRRPDDVQLAWQEFSRVAFARLTDEQIEMYLATRTWRGCSGAYAVQEEGDPYLRVIAGSVSNVIGLPLETTQTLLRTFGGVVPHSGTPPA